MMTPERCEIIDGSRARSRRTAGIRFWFSSLNHSLSSSAAKPPPGALEPPSTLTRMSMPPSCCSTDCATALAPSAVERSAARKRTPSAGCAGTDRAVATTCAPASRRVSTTAAPTPLVPPVTNARRWASCRSKVMARSPLQVLTGRVGGLHLAQVAPGTDRPLRDVARRDESQRGDGVLVLRLRSGLAPLEGLFQQRLQRRTAFEGCEGDHADRFRRLFLRLPDQLVLEVLTGKRDDPAVVVLDDLVLPEEPRGSVEDWAAEDQV